MATAPLLVLSLADTLMHRQAALQAARTRLHDQARQTAERADDTLQDAGDVLQVMARMPLPEGPLDGCPAMLRAAGNHPLVASILVARLDGHVVCATRPRLSESNVADRPWFTAAARSNAVPHMVGPIMDEMAVDETADGAVVVATPLAAAPGVLAIRLNLGWLAQPGLETLLIDRRSGALLAHASDTAATSWSDRASSDALLLAARRAALHQAAAEREASGVIEVPGEEGDGLFGYARLTDGTMMSVVGNARAAVMQDANQQLRVALLLAAALGCLALGVAWYFARCWVVMPLRRLSLATALFGRGEFPAGETVSPTDPPEFRSLRTTLDGMARRLRSGGGVANARVTPAASRDSAWLVTALRPVPAEERPTHQDPATGLLNRRGFDMALGLEYRAAARLGTPLALIMVEIECLRAGRTIGGHLPGLARLRGMARVIDRQLRQTHDRAACYGEGVFAAILPATDEGHAMIIAKTIRRAAEEAGLISAGSPAIWHCSGVASGGTMVRIGVAAFLPGRDDGGPARLVELAQAALYDAKRYGGTRAASQLSR